MADATTPPATGAASPEVSDKAKELFARLKKWADELDKNKLTVSLIIAIIVLAFSTNRGGKVYQQVKESVKDTKDAAMEVLIGILDFLKQPWIIILAIVVVFIFPLTVLISLLACAKTAALAFIIIEAMLIAPIPMIIGHRVKENGKDNLLSKPFMGTMKILYWSLCFVILISGIPSLLLSSYLTLVLIVIGLALAILSYILASFWRKALVAIFIVALIPHLVGIWPGYGYFYNHIAEKQLAAGCVITPTIELTAYNFTGVAKCKIAPETRLLANFQDTSKVGNRVTVKCTIIVTNESFYLPLLVSDAGGGVNFRRVGL